MVHRKSDNRMIVGSLNLRKDEVVGRALKEYVSESFHQSGGVWDGYRPYHMIGIRMFLRDFLLYMENMK